LHAPTDVAFTRLGRLHLAILGTELLQGPCKRDTVPETV